jgi:hypothetical protein
MSKQFQKLRFQVLTAASMKMAVSWDVVPYSLVEVYRRFRGDCCLHHQGTHRPHKGDSKHLYNVCKLIPDYTAQHPRRQSTSVSVIIFQCVS